MDPHEYLPYGYASIPKSGEERSRIWNCLVSAFGVRKIRTGISILPNTFPKTVCQVYRHQQYMKAPSDGHSTSVWLPWPAQLRGWTWPGVGRDWRKDRQTNTQTESWVQMDWTLWWRNPSTHRAQCVNYTELNREVESLHTAEQGAGWLQTGLCLELNQGGRFC